MLPNRHRVLVVDDERAIASTLAMILDHRGYETATAYSGEQAIQMAFAFHPDCIVSDITMGGMNGIEAAIDILRHLPSCKVLFMSGNANSEGLLDKARARGFDFQVLLKPVPPSELLARIAQILLSSGTQSRRISA